ncbi:NADH dehydrogenase [ubiquinone] 1 alpha subcomplex subunit 5-like [Corticium candelabrum]|uniref:NADH dehydrogenase [ubiquinone] 1 alpha subcomplex subunit 5-like n=1 Tax=Corticium candelabrum TaxID=121492 RepID=UPI002E258805|nr:NADH dehydrogenase [ubiquinone] 1 alpha subcomplex subunit 5-like [Corticium candelabrum]XP_062510941.1 NADH dehydrogenase [ubiquinone] 1 alpha subcomplex subunit 5-like [Corticium candelabrum]
MALRKSTGIVGLAVIHNSREVLIGIYQKTLKALTRLPSDAAYRRHTEETTKQRLKIAEQEESVEQIEAKINAGQIEQIIEQAEVELSLVSRMKEWAPWDPLVGKAPPTQWEWP